MSQLLFGVYPPVGAPPPPPSLQFDTSALPSGVQGVAYSVFLQASGGTTPYTWSQIAGSLVGTGLSLNTSTGQILGTPSSAGTISGLQFRVQDATANTANSGLLSIVVNAAASPVTVTTSSLPVADRGQSYNAPLTAIGGTGPYTWSLVAPNNTLPSGLNLVGSAITGTPTVAGSVDVEVRATDSLGAVDDSGILPLNVAQVAALAITTSAVLVNGEDNTPYPSTTFNTSGGYGAVTWVKTAGDYPTGLTLVGNVLSGTPTAPDIFTFTLRAEDSEGRQDSRTFEITIVAEGTVEGAHDYFASLQALPEHYNSWSARDQAQLDVVVNNGSVGSLVFTFDPDNDTHPEKQDACRLYKDTASRSVPGTQQLWFRANPVITTGSVIVTWDWYWTQDWMGTANRGTVNNYKSWQFMIDNDGYWTLMNVFTIGQGQDPTCVSGIWDEFRSYGRPDGMIRNESVLPSGEGTYVQYPNSAEKYKQFPSRWIRYWIEYKFNLAPSAFTEWADDYNGGVEIGPNPNDPSGNWNMVSLWSSDEVRGLQRCLYKVPMNWRAPLADNRFTAFRWEFNVSSGTLANPLVAYGRNVVFLKDYELPAVPEEDTFLFQQPVR